MKRCLALFLISISPLVAQNRDFLTSNEVDQIRETQEPNLRLNIYLLFARQRLDQVQQQISKDKKGRSLAIRQLLEEYTQIIDAIDTVSDDALKRKVNITEGAAAVAAAEKKFTLQLNKILDSRPSDLDMYEISLKAAISDTDDSTATAQEDLGKRGEAVEAKAAKEKQDLENNTSKEQLKEQKAEDAKADPNAGKPTRKPPTLYRPGEKPADPNQ